MNWAHALLRQLGWIVAVGAVGKANAQDARELEFADMQQQLVLEEQIAIGSMDGEHDVFGRIMNLAIDSRGRLVIADDLSQNLKVFELTGEFVATIGRSGEGPGEFYSPGKCEWVLGTVSMSGIRDTQRFRCSVPTMSSSEGSWSRRAGP